VRIGITGHSNLAPKSVPAVADALRNALKEVDPPLVGVSCLARGADQVFADVVLQLGGSLEVILPAADYREDKVKPDNREQFERLLAHADAVRVMPFAESGRDAYMAASEAVLSGVERMVAVWDGHPSDGRGGTADVVTAARERGIHVEIVWPPGSMRT
jgi:hypothetical protein